MSSERVRIPAPKSLRDEFAMAALPLAHSNISHAIEHGLELKDDTTLEQAVVGVRA